MSDVRNYTRRSATTPIDPALVVPGSRWVKNRAEHQGKPPVFVAVDAIEDTADVGGTTKTVHYHNEDSGRRGSMLLRDFVKGSEHRLPDPELVAVDTARPDDAPATVADVREIKATLAEILDRLPARSPRQLHLVGS